MSGVRASATDGVDFLVAGYDACCKAGTGNDPDHELGNTVSFACAVCSACQTAVNDRHDHHEATHLFTMIKRTFLGCLLTVMHVFQRKTTVCLQHTELHYVAAQSCLTSLMALAAVLVTSEPLPFANAEGLLRLLSPAQQPGQQSHGTHHQAEAQAPHPPGSSGHSFTKHSAVAGESLFISLV